MNTSVIATSKDGKQITYNTIEEASEATQLSVNSIKSRANKPGSGSKSKDGYTFIWADESVRRSQQAKKNKHKGSNFELEIAKKLREIGYEGVVSSRSTNKRADADKIDLWDQNGELPINIQAKYTQNLPNFFEIRNACSDKSKPFCLAWKKAGKNGESSPGTVMILPIDYFYQLISK